MSDKGGAPKGNQNGLRHGLNAVKARVKVRGLQAIDLRTSAARGMMAFRDDLVQALGGPETITPQQRAVVDLAARTRLYVEHLDAWLMEQRSLILYRKKAVLPALRERTQLADALARYLSQIGMERKAKQVPSLAEYLATRSTSETAEAAAEVEASHEN